MTTVYRPFERPRRLVEFVGQVGADIGGLLLPPAAYEAIAESKTTGIPCELVATGEEVDPENGDRWLVYAATREHIEATTDWRWDSTTKQLRYLCPECEMWDGRHKKACSR